MNTNSGITRILCYGDSNVWGRSGASIERYSQTVRWTALLQRQLGAGYEIIEEGLRSRTTDLEDNDPQFPGRNGAAYLRPCLESHQPLNMVILWIGTNDLKAKFNRSASKVTSAVEKLVQMIHEVTLTMNGTSAQIILVAPPLVREEVLKPHSLFVGAGEKSQQLATLYRNLAERYSCIFVDMSQHVQAGESDGVHLEPESHSKIAEIMYQHIKK